MSKKNQRRRRAGMAGRQALTTTGVAMLMLAVSVGASADGLLDRPVKEFLFRGKSHPGEIGHMVADGPGFFPGAVHNLALHTELPIAIEALPEAASEKPVPVEINAVNTTVGKILADLVRQDPRYVYRERLGIIEVLPAKALTNSGDCLNMVIPAFRTEEEWNYLLLSLKCQIDRVANKKDVIPNPIRAGVCPAGSFGALSHPPRGVIQMSFENEPLRDILSKLAVRAGNIAWWASFQGAVPACERLSISDYQPRQWFGSDGPGPATWSEGLPQKCVSCHYHSK